ncbi:MAG: hypothetical protein KAH01_02610 [Caldisericia bacterium]|nr:hypothetical protein [Caldisericia bacterium]
MKIYSFNTQQNPKLTEVGGKAKALIETKNAGFPVPEGLVLSVSFFNEWLDEIKTSNEWKAVLENTTKEACDLMKYKAANMTFTAKQKKAFEISTNDLTGELFAIRSSSPEEDLAGTSFAGMYETFLGVSREKLEEFIAKAFASCFDFRVMEYKRQNNIGIEGTAIAVIVQKQISSDVSGVGFSLNPLNNAFDEVFINASFGLGEAIVSGIVTPDTFIVDSVKGEIIEKQVHEKLIALWLKNSGGIEEQPNQEPKKQALTDQQIMELSQLIKKTETYYNKPMDTEWAFENGKLYLLQSRPITTYFPFFKELLTEPGRNKRFYIDIMALTQGFDEPMSVLGMELWANMLYDVKMHMMSPQINGSVPVAYGKEYMSITALQKVLGKKAGFNLIANFDGNLKKIFKSIDINAHPFEGKVEGTQDFKKVAAKSALTMLPSGLAGVFGNYKKAVKTYKSMTEEILEELHTLDSTGEFSTTAIKALRLMDRVMGTAPVIFAGLVSKNKIQKIFKGDDVEKEISAMNMDLDGNPTSEMGHLLFSMSSEEAFKRIMSREEFITKAEKREFSGHLLEMYDEFMAKYSVRGFKEIDVASKRIYEDKGMIYDRLIEINTDENQILTVKEKRRIAYEKLLIAAKEKGKEKQFVKSVARMKATFGYREHPKYLVVIIFAKIHDICLDIAQTWVKNGKLDSPYDIFDLKSSEISQGQNDESFDFRKARDNNLSGYITTKKWPLVIDSRGKIYKAKLESKDGDYVGSPIAPGKITGKAKVLHSPYEKPLNSGEILVAKFTEPSWTPIFTNAAGVVMEIGGPLQHGGIIAREYGIPCVSGLMGIMDIIKDGDLVEVDGTNGIVRIKCTGEA